MTTSGTVRKALVVLALGVGVIACEGGAPWNVHHAHATQTIYVNESEDLSGDVYALTPSDVIVTKSAGSVCYATDRTHEDTRQLYTDCAAFVAAGGTFGK